MKLTYFILALMVVLASCKDSDSDTNETETNTDNTEVTETNNTEVQQTPEQTDSDHFIAVYLSCAVYAGATEYEFQPAQGDPILIRVSHSPQDEPGVFSPDIPYELVEEVTEELEGPPGPNPEYVGKSFNLYFEMQDGERVITRIELYEVGQ